MKPATPHKSQRGLFTWLLYDEIEKNRNIHLISVDLGMGQFDAIRDDFPEQITITGASEQGAMDTAIGMALAGKTTFIYSITPFLIYRPFEALRTYINHESIPVHLVGGGRAKDYESDGYSHDATDVKFFLNGFENIDQYWPKTMLLEEMQGCLRKILENNRASFISLRR